MKGLRVWTTALCGCAITAVTGGAQLPPHPTGCLVFDSTYFIMDGRLRTSLDSTTRGTAILRVEDVFFPQGDTIPVTPVKPSDFGEWFGTRRSFLIVRSPTAVDLFWSSLKTSLAGRFRLVGDSLVGDLRSHDGRVLKARASRMACPTNG